MARPHSVALRSLSGLYPRLPSIDLVRVADVDLRRAEAAADTLGWREAAADWRRVTEAVDVDAVIIITPNDHHHDAAVDALRHGKDVLCEKPLAPDPSTARCMFEAADDSSLCHQIGFVYRKWPPMRLARQLIQQGELGRIISFRAHFFHDYGLDRTLERTWRFDRSRAGAGSVGDIGSHIIDLARFLVGEITDVMAQSQTVIHERPAPKVDPASDDVAYAISDKLPVDVDDATVMLVRFANGVLGTLETSWVATGYKTDLSFEVLGDQGAVRFTWRRSNELTFHSVLDPDVTAGDRAVIMGPAHEGAADFYGVPGVGLGWQDVFTLAARDFVAAIASGEPASPDFGDGLRSCEVVAAAQESASSGRWVPVDVPGLATRTSRRSIAEGAP
jgi:predicted dehydrogenase